jgi:hypothetical protein
VPTFPPPGRKGGNAFHQGGEAMTEVTYFEDFYCFEYHSRQEAPQRFRYYLHSPVYAFCPALSSSSTQRDFDREETVLSSDFLPSRLARHFEDS